MNLIPLYVSIFLNMSLFCTPNGFLYKGVVFHRLTRADDRVFPRSPIAEYNGISPRHCGLKCFNHHLCSSFFINKEKKVCKLAGEVDDRKLIKSSGYRYYVSEDCKRSDLGWEYRGTRGRTVAGVLCQRWDQQHPRKHSYQFLAGAQNYCRNPAKAYAKEPWCYTTETNKTWDYCYVPKCVTKARECRTTDRGEDYFGTVSWTASGRGCHRWGDRLPGNQSYAILRAEENYCRNPFGEKAAPWCYTMKDKNEYELCDIPKC